ncbi:hypothetical protein BASA81_011368 [Batrachochytrium salamandrivorans]|nr:hypothetical protein BASA81_011368 [Batrachochytrium salamandrivorans]
MSNLKEIVASLTDRLRSLELENQTLQQVNHFANSREPKAALPDKFDGSRRHSAFHQPAGTGLSTPGPTLRHRSQKDRHSWNTTNGQSSSMVQPQRATGTLRL